MTTSEGVYMTTGEAVYMTTGEGGHKGSCVLQTLMLQAFRLNLL